MQKTLLSNTENQPGYQPDEFGSKRVEELALRPQVENMIRIDAPVRTRA
jgi:hypothetical protein